MQDTVNVKDSVSLDEILEALVALSIVAKSLAIKVIALKNDNKEEN